MILEQLKTTEKRSEIRVRIFRDATPEDVIRQLEIERFTGNMTVNMSQGGVCGVQVEERIHLTGRNNSA